MSFLPDRGSPKPEGRRRVELPARKDSWDFLKGSGPSSPEAHVVEKHRFKPGWHEMRHRDQPDAEQVKHAMQQQQSRFEDQDPSMIQALGGDVLAGYDSRNGSPSPSPWLNRRHAAALAAQHRGEDAGSPPPPPWLNRRHAPQYPSSEVVSSQGNREKQTERIHEMRKQRIMTEGLVVTKRPDNVDSLLHRPPSGPASAEYAAQSQHMPKRPAMQR